MTILTLFGLPLATILAFIVSVAIPFLSALVTRAHWPSELVGLLTLALATANGFFSEWAASPDRFNWRYAVGTAVISYVIAVATHYGVLKGTATNAKLLAFPTVRATPSSPPAQKAT